MTGALGREWKAERSSTAFLVPEQKYHQGRAMHTAAPGSGRTTQTFLHAKPGEGYLQQLLLFSFQHFSILLPCALILEGAVVQKPRNKAREAL